LFQKDGWYGAIEIFSIILWPWCR